MLGREEYFGLRIRHKTIHSRAINIPVNSTVGPSGEHCPSTLLRSSWAPLSCLFPPAAAVMLMQLNAVCTGCVLVTFKSRFSVPPYRIENRTTDVVVYFAQSSLKATRENWNWLSPLPGGSAMAYAWDEPTYDHRLQVQVSLTLVTFALALLCLLTRSLVAAPDRRSAEGPAFARCRRTCRTASGGLSRRPTNWTSWAARRR